jgi:hypothetical protein
MVKLFLVNILPTLDRQVGNKFLMEYDVCKPNLTAPEYLMLSLYSILLTCVSRVRVRVKKKILQWPQHFHKRKLYTLPRLNTKRWKRKRESPYQHALARHALIHRSSSICSVDPRIVYMSSRNSVATLNTWRIARTMHGLYLLWLTHENIIDLVMGLRVGIYAFFMCVNSVFFYVLFG